MATKDSPSKTPEGSPPPRSPEATTPYIELSFDDDNEVLYKPYGNGNGGLAKPDPAQQQQQAAETAVDDTEDLFDDQAVEEKRKNLGYTTRRRQSNNRPGRRAAAAPHKFTKVEAVLPFRFHPNIRPLTIADLESCVALEDAAFADPEHRCTREKVNYFFVSFYTTLFLVFSLEIAVPPGAPSFTSCIVTYPVAFFHYLLLLPHIYGSANTAHIVEP